MFFSGLKGQALALFNLSGAGARQENAAGQCYDILAAKTKSAGKNRRFQ